MGAVAAAAPATSPPISANAAARSASREKGARPAERVSAMAARRVRPVWSVARRPMVASTLRPTSPAVAPAVEPALPALPAIPASARATTMATATEAARGAAPPDSVCATRRCAPRGSDACHLAAADDAPPALWTSWGVHDGAHLVSVTLRRRLCRLSLTATAVPWLADSRFTERVGRVREFTPSVPALWCMANPQQPRNSW